jgi:flagellar biosynthesis chaperone FliJ
MLLALTLALIVGAGAWMHRQSSHPDEAAALADGHSALQPQTAAGINHQAKEAGLQASGSNADGKPNAPAKFDPLDTIEPPTFKADAHGALVMEAQTRVDVERINALYQRDVALAKLEAFSLNLPDTAKRELKDLYQQYAQYAQAVTQTYQPGLSIGTVDEAARQLQGLHDLRQQYFGAERAEALFGQEEKTSQELIALMRQQSPNLSLEEKAAHAQEAWKKAHPEAAEGSH